MTIVVRPPLEEASQKQPIASRGDFTLALVRLCMETEADHYMILDIPPASTGRAAKVVASNWPYDTIEIVGVDRIARLAAGPHATGASQAPKPLHPVAAHLPADIAFMEDAARLEQLGHAELYCLRLNAGQRRYFALLSSTVPGRMKGEAVSSAQLGRRYMLSEMMHLFAPAEIPNPLSERERDCLFWAAEGKTTDEMALILDVSHNTVNSYMQQAIRKLSAPNRAKAVATAIRNGLL